MFCGIHYTLLWCLPDKIQQAMSFVLTLPHLLLCLAQTHDQLSYSSVETKMSKTCALLACESFFDDCLSLTICGCLELMIGLEPNQPLHEWKALLVVQRKFYCDFPTCTSVPPQVTPFTVLVFLLGCVWGGPFSLRNGFAERFICSGVGWGRQESPIVQAEVYPHNLASDPLFSPITFWLR